jgi:hypothetical protein
MSVSYASCNAEVDIVGVVDDDENIKQLLNLSTIFVVDVCKGCFIFMSVY